MERVCCYQSFSALNRAGGVHIDTPLLSDSATDFIHFLLLFSLIWSYLRAIFFSHRFQSEIQHSLLEYKKILFHTIFQVLNSIFVLFSSTIFKYL